MKETDLKIMFFTPYYHQNRGNSTTAKRIEHGLKEESVSVTVFAYEEEPITAKLEEKMREADLFHILQFARFSKWIESHSMELNKPYIITSGGTDINHSLKENNEKYRSLLRNAKAISVFTDEAKEYLIRDIGFNESFVHVIPQGIYLPENGIGQEKLHFPKGSPRILLPAGLRPVKDVFFAVDVIQKLTIHFPGIVFLILGANLDNQVYLNVQEATKKYEWFNYKADIDLTFMKEAYQWADIVINTSISEGQPTSLLEAMFMKKPVVARKISGNSSIIIHEINGLLFEDHQGLYDSLKQLLIDNRFYQRISKNGYQTVKENHTIKQEVDSYIKLYTLL